MRRRQTSKGQILILALLFLLGLVVIFALISTTSVRVRGAPIVLEAVWLVNNQEVSTASVGEEIKARVVVEATEEYVGSIVVKIKKDIARGFDSDFHLATIPVNLRGGEEKHIDLTFTPDEASGVGGFLGFGSLRGYFIEVDFQATRTTWVMENSYPPRLRVTD